jgi:hypothetical protein
VKPYALDLNNLIFIKNNSSVREEICVFPDGIEFDPLGRR